MHLPDHEFARCGVLTTDQACGSAGRGLVRGHVRLGRWRQICPGILLTGNGDLTPAPQHWVAVLVAGRGALLAKAAAAVAGGIRSIQVEQLPVLIPAVRGVSRRIPRLPPDMPTVRAHRSAVLPVEHRQNSGIPRTTMARSVVDAASWAPPDHAAVLIVAAACRQRGRSIRC